MLGHESGCCQLSTMISSENSRADLWSVTNMCAILAASHKLKHRAAMSNVAGVAIDIPISINK